RRYGPIANLVVFFAVLALYVAFTNHLERQQRVQRETSTALAPVPAVDFSITPLRSHESTLSVHRASASRGRRGADRRDGL
ncbi:MAG: hypothetical protein ACREP0_14500, partial [Rhodanobacteraceae bacterium]